MFTEELLRQANERYKVLGLGVIEKIPTEWIPLRGARGEIVNAKVDDRNKGVLDFMGFAPGIGGIYFDAKEVAEGDRWELKSIEAEQIANLERWDKMSGAVAFTIHSFLESQAAYLLPAPYLIEKFRAWERFGGRQVPASLKEAEIAERGIRIRTGRGLVFDWMPALIEYIKRREVLP